MKLLIKISSLTLVALGFLVIAPSAYAHDLATSTASTTREEHRKEHQEELRDRQDDRRESIEQKREGLQEHREDRREDRDERLRDGQKERIQNHITRFTRILNVAIERAHKFIARVDARADELDAQGKNTAPARAYLATAEAELVLVKTALDDIQDDLDEIIATTTPQTRESLKSLLGDTKDVLNDAKENIRDAFQAVRDAVKALKEIANPEDSEDDN